SCFVRFESSSLPTNLPTDSDFYPLDPTTNDVYSLSLHDALPICGARMRRAWARTMCGRPTCSDSAAARGAITRCRSSARTTPRSDRKSTRLNSSHDQISYAVFCLKKKIKDCVSTDILRLTQGINV